MGMRPMIIQEAMQRRLEDRLKPPEHELTPRSGVDYENGMRPLDGGI